jgi:serine/arginine repetitive matrix protein 1
MPSIKGTASVLDARARSKELKSTKFPKNFSQSISLDKLNKPVFAQWIEQKVATILGFDDEIVSSTAINLFLPENDSESSLSSSGLDPRRAQLDLAGFLGDDESAKFAKELWSLMIEAAESGVGIPKTLLEQKKRELAEQKKKNEMAVNLARDHRNHLQQQQQQQPFAPPRMDHFVQEATRRADRARQAMGGGVGGRMSRWGNRPDAPNQPPEAAPIPASPTNPNDQQHSIDPSSGGSNATTGRSNHERLEDDGQKLNHYEMDRPAVDQFGRLLPPLQRRNLPDRKEVNQRRSQDHDRTNMPPRPYAEGRAGWRGSSRSRSRDRDSNGRGRRGGGAPDRTNYYDGRNRREDAYPRFDYDRSRHGDRLDYRDRHYSHRQHDRDHFHHRDSYERYNRSGRPGDVDEMDDLKRRLIFLRKESSRRKDKDPKLDEEIARTKDRLYDLERHHRRHDVRGREREGDADHRRSDRSHQSPAARRRLSGSRSPSPKRRNGGGGRERDDSDSSGSEESSHSSHSRRSFSDGESDDGGRKSRSRIRSPGRSPRASRSNSRSKSPSNSQNRSPSNSPSNNSRKSRSSSEDSRRGRRGEDTTKNA